MKKLMLVVMLAGFVFGLIGCEGYHQRVADPNSGLNTAVNTTEGLAPLGPVIGGALTTAGVPWGWLIGLIGTTISAAIGVFKTYKKNIVIDGQDQEYANIAETTKAIVDTIEAVASTPLEDGTVGSLIKSKIGNELKEKEIYKVGKAIISGLKS